MASPDRVAARSSCTGGMNSASGAAIQPIEPCLASSPTYDVADVIVYVDPIFFLARQCQQATKTNTKKKTHAV